MNYELRIMNKTVEQKYNFFDLGNSGLVTVSAT
jgi:hypothetical protein